MSGGGGARKDPGNYMKYLSKMELTIPMKLCWILFQINPNKFMNQQDILKQSCLQFTFLLMLPSSNFMFSPFSGLWRTTYCWTTAQTTCVSKDEFQISSWEFSPMGIPDRVTMKSESSWLCPESQCFALCAAVTWRLFSTRDSKAQTFKYNMIPGHKRQENTLRCQHFGIQSLPQEGSSLFSTFRGPERNTNYSNVNEHIPIIVLMTLTPSPLRTLRDSAKSLSYAWFGI